MNTRNTPSCRWGRFALTPIAFAIAWSSAAGAAEHWLCAKPVTLTMPDGQTIPMWGFAEDSANFGGGCAAEATVPGPELRVLAGDNTLTVHLRNSLPEPTSIVIPGQLASMTPVKVNDADGRPRVRSFTAEAAAGNGEQTYTWTSLRPGTYLYHSGTHPQVQVQMGLYGAVLHDAGTGLAYAGVPYDHEATLLFSEIDPVLHAAVDEGRYGQPVPDPLPAGLTAADYPSSTVNYSPSYFLINGAPHSATSTSVPAGNVGQTTLLRLLNAGIESSNAILQGMYMDLVAEDGYPYPYAREQYSAFLPALKTVDAIISPTETATFPLYDRRLDLTTPGNPGPGSTAGGMLAMLAVGDAAAGTPTAAADAYSTPEDTLLTEPAPGVLGNDTGTGLSAVLVSSASQGNLTLNPDGSFDYTPNGNFFGTDSFTYKASDGTLSSTPATVTLTVTAVADAPTAVNDAYSIMTGGTLDVAAPGVLANDSDVDGDTLTATNASAPTGGTLNSLGADGAFSYTAPATAGTYSFTYDASDGALTSTATVTITAIQNQPPVAVKDTASTARNTAVRIDVLANDSDPDGNLLPATIAIVTVPNKGGTATPVDNGTNTAAVLYTPKNNFRGSENFSYTVQDSGGATSNTVTVRVNVK